MQLILSPQQDLEQTLKKASLFLQKNQVDHAIDLYQTTLKRYPKEFIIWHNLSLLQKQKKNILEFIKCSRQAYLLNPSALQTKIHLAQSLLYEEKEKGETLFNQLMEENTTSWEIRFAYAETLITLGDLSYAEKLLLSCPKNAHVLHLLASIELANGNLSSGSQILQKSYSLSHTTSIPIWNGEDVTNKTLFIDTQNNLEDVLFFFRFIPMTNVHFCLDQSYASALGNLLIKNLPSNVKIYEKQDEIDAICSLADLPTLSQEASFPYLQPDEAQTEFWKKFLCRDLNYKIALLEYEDSESICSPIPSVPGVTFYKLHQQKNSCFNPNSIDLSKKLPDLESIFSLLTQMHLVITTSKILGHLAGALGKPTFLLLHSHKRSKWFAKDKESAWYPSLTLFTFHDLATFKSSVEKITTQITLEVESLFLFHKAIDLHEKGHHSEAMKISKKLMEKNPKDIRAWRSLSYSAFKEKNYPLSLEYLKQGAIYDNEDPLFALDLSSALCYEGRASEAEALLRPILAKYPQKFSLAYTNLGIALSMQEKMEESIELLNTAVSLDPKNIKNYINLSCTYLRNGDLQKGWQFSLASFALKNQKTLKTPIWRGENLAGKTLLVVHDQGFGDCIQFIRYLPLLEQKGVKILLDPRTMESLKSLFVRSFPEKFHFYQKDMAVDYVCSVVVLGLIYRTTLSTIPANVPYLIPSPYKVSDWKKKFAKDPCYKVGLVWKGNPNQINNYSRSTTLAKLSSFLSKVKNCTFYGLQKEHEESAPEEMSFIDLSTKLKTFDDTAAILTQLDLLITVDTSVAHLAGALGIPTWLILGYPSAQQWLLNREDSPWYPTLRLFRSESHDGLDLVLENVKQQLIELSKK